jgi:hypothetical protein
LLLGVWKKEDSMTIPHDLLNDLRRSPTDLARIVEAVVRDGVPYVKIPVQAVSSLALLGFGLIVAATAVVALLGAPPAEAQGEPVLTFEGRVTSVSPREMLVAAERDGVVVDVVMIDLARIPQSETRQIAQDDIVVVIGFIRRPGHKVIATSVQPVSRWFPTTPAWAPPVR